AERLKDALRREALRRLAEQEPRVVGRLRRLEERLHQAQHRMELIHRVLKQRAHHFGDVDRLRLVEQRQDEYAARTRQYGCLDLRLHRKEQRTCETTLRVSFEVDLG